MLFFFTNPSLNYYKIVQCQHHFFISEIVPFTTVLSLNSIPYPLNHSLTASPSPRIFAHYLTIVVQLYYRPTDTIVVSPYFHRHCLAVFLADCHAVYRLAMTGLCFYWTSYQIVLLCCVNHY
jgi:hypothetical protein